jgi:hypothetical protein
MRTLLNVTVYVHYLSCLPNLCFKEPITTVKLYL